MTVLVFPREQFTSDSKLAKILNFLGWKITHDRTSTPDLAIWHSDEAFECLDNPVVNCREKSIDKARVNEVFEKVFGYPIGVDPWAYNGLAVEKILGHQKHGVVVRCPCAPKRDRVYQKLIVNHPDESWLEEWRIDLYGNSFLLSRKQLDKGPNGFRNPEPRPGAFHFDVKDKIFDDSEMLKIALFTKRIGLDYGSLDALRDLDGRLYIIDATTQTSCPNPMWHGNATEHQYIKRSAAMFEEAFGK